MIEVGLNHYLIVSAVLFVLGMVGVLVRRNALVMLMSIELMLNAINLTFVAYGQHLKSPDGSIIAFQSYRKGLYDLYQKPVTGGGVEEALLESSENKNIYDWSPDGRFILYSSQNPKTARDLWALPLQGDRKPFVVTQTEFEEVGGKFSPDGRWIAYQSNETGRSEIYVQPFPGPGGKSRISTNGTLGSPRWRGDGREIFYLAPDNRLMAAPITLPGNGQAVAVGTPVALFTTRTGSSFAASPDGQRFLVNTALEDAVTAPITVILNWAGGKK